jgi:hypothetical protein
MKKTQLAKAIAFAITGAALTAGSVSTASAAVTTMYNLTTGGGEDNSTNTTDPFAGGVYHTSQYGNTDGWTNGAGSNYDSTVGSGAPSTWAGTSSASTAAFGYAGPHLNWGINITGGAGGSGNISAADSFSRYGIYADIDTAQGAWSDNVSTNVGVKGGWRHDLDVGLFKSDTSGLVTISAEGILNTGNSNYGFTIFKGIDTSTTYNHHGSWNSTTNDAGLTSNSLPGGGFNLPLSSVVAYSVGDPVTNIGTISFNAEANQVYTILIGGYRTGDWGTTIDGYKLSVSQVPVPAAVWLFGSALAGFMGIGRHKKQIAA